MKIHFNLPYYTRWGESLKISGSLPQLGGGDLAKTISMNYAFPDRWTFSIEVLTKEPCDFTYNYLLGDENTGIDIIEAADPRLVHIDPSEVQEIYLDDAWVSPSALDNVFLTSPFCNILFRERFTSSPELKSDNKYTHVFRVMAPMLQNNEVVCLLGSSAELGNWNNDKPLLMHNDDSPWWTVRVNLSKRKGDVYYKYGIFDPEDNRFKILESGADRHTFVPEGKKKLTLVNDAFINVSEALFHGAGVGIPVFSLRSRQSFGVGDFEDLKLMVDWAVRVGLKLIQVLPLNDSTGTHTDSDVLPYAAISSYALNPLFLNLRKMGKLPDTNPWQKEYNKKQKEFNQEPLVRFLDVINYKLAYAKELYNNKKKKIETDKDYLDFVEKNKQWLYPYAEFCMLRDQFETSDYTQWKDYSTYDREMFPNGYEGINVYFFIQYHLHLQLTEAVDYAHKNGIILKGDIPIGVNRNSADTWSNPELYHLDCQAGAPPDMFSIKGQNWELPTYNWEKMEETGFAWWKSRLSHTAQYFDTFRIDHILGFFRIWQIPLEQEEGIMGYLNPSIPVHINEFAQKGVHFDYDRYCLPYITDSILHDFFGEDASWVRANCIDQRSDGKLLLKSSNASQKLIRELYNQGIINDKVRKGLFDLVANILFIERPGSNRMEFFPRIGMHYLRSFQELDNYTRERLDELYIDYFYHRQDQFWKISGLKKLPVLKRGSKMLFCGEDLGMMTGCVTSVMKQLGILSLEVQRTPKVSNKDFAHPADAPYLSVVTPATHDMSTIRGWWEEDRSITQLFYNQQLGHGGEAPYFAEPWICRDILLQHLYSPSMWAIFQWQDLMSLSSELRRENPHEERINVPSNTINSWRYRMHLYLEDLLEEDEFNDKLRNYIVQSGR